MGLTDRFVSLMGITDKDEMDRAVNKLSEKTAKSLLALLVLTMNQQRVGDLEQGGIPIDLDRRSEV